MMTKNQYIFFSVLLFCLTAFGTYISLSAGETWLQALERAGYPCFGWLLLSMVRYRTMVLFSKTTNPGR